MRLYYAQNKEDLLIGSFFPDVEEGFYIDVGANDPVIDSVTKLFYDRGWHGVSVEPILRHFEALQRARPRDTTLQAGLSNKAGTLTFTEYPEGDGLSTFDDSIQDYYKHEDHPYPTDKTKKYEVSVKTLADVIKEAAPKHIHFIKIDVEGYEYEVIEGYDWEKLRPELICIEANHIHKDWRKILASKRYHEVYFDGINNYYLAEESLHRKEFFNYPNAAFSGNPVYYPAYLETEQLAEKKLQELAKVVADREQKIADLHGQQRDVRFLAKRLATEVQLRLHKRAKGVSNASQLYYGSDARIRHMVEQADESPEALLAFIQERDKANIARQRVAFKQTAKRWFWKFAAKSFTASLLIGRKVAGRFL